MQLAASAGPPLQHACCFTLTWSACAALPCSAPGVDVNDPDTTQTTTTIKVTPPEGGPFDKFILTVCRVGAQPADCKDVTCLPDKVAACPITGLTDNTP